MTAPRSCAPGGGGGGGARGQAPGRAACTGAHGAGAGPGPDRGAPEGRGARGAGRKRRCASGHRGRGGNPVLAHAAHDRLLRYVPPGPSGASSGLPLPSPDFLSGSLGPGPPSRRAAGVPLLSDLPVVAARFRTASRGRPPSARGPWDLSRVSHGGPSVASHYGESSIHSNEGKSGLTGTVETMERLSGP